MSNSKRLGDLNKRVGNTKQETGKASNFQWRVWVGLITLVIVTFMDFQWIWSVLFLFWIIPDIRNRVTYFIEPVYRDENPLLYWTIVGTWIMMSALSLSSLFVS